MINGKALWLPPSKQGKGHYLPILEALVGQLDAMLSHHCKVLVFRLDLHLYQGSDDNAVLSAFIRRYRSWAERQGHHHIGFIWCREQHSSTAQHYHCAFMLDGNKHRHPHRIIEAIERLWRDRELGYVHTPKRCYKLLKRDDSATYQQVFNRCSYLAKVATKQQRLPTTNDYSASRIKVKQRDD